MWSPYVRAIELEAGDTIEIALAGPGGASLARATTTPLDHDKAQYVQIVGKKRPPTGWPRGVYTADIRIHRKGAVVLQAAGADGALTPAAQRRGSHGQVTHK